MNRFRSLSLAVAVLTLATQVVAAAHSPAMHEEPVSKCRDQGAHFCAEVTEHETGPCVLCHVNLNGLFHDAPSIVLVALRTEAAVAAVDSPESPSALLAAHAPRGPPVG